MPEEPDFTQEDIEILEEVWRKRQAAKKEKSMQTMTAPVVASNQQYVDVEIKGVLIPRMKVMPAQYKGRCCLTGEWYDPKKGNFTIAYKHKDQLTDAQKRAVFGDGVVYNVTVLVSIVQDTQEVQIAPAGKKEWVPSKYQEVILENLLGNTMHIFIEALAGCGKTVTLVWLVKEMMKRGMRGMQVIYMAFNKSIQEELVKKLMGTGCPAMTTHSFGLQLLKKNFKELEQAGNSAVQNNKTSDLFIQLLAMDLFGECSAQAMKKVKKTDHYKCRKAVLSLVGFIKNWAILPRLTDDGWDFAPEQKERVLEFFKTYQVSVPDNFTKEQICNYACRVVCMSVPMPGAALTRVTYDDMLYLPLALGLTFPKYDIILTDESQDFNEAQEQFLFRLDAKGARCIVVGDEHQCCVEGTIIDMGDNNQKRIESVVAGDLVKVAAGNCDVCGNFVTEAFHREVNNREVVEIITKSGKRLTTTPEHTHFAGFNMRSSSDNYYVYLMYRSDFGYRIGITRNFQLRLNQERADKIWLIGTYQDEGEARYYEQLYSVTYGLPTWIFNTSNRDVKYASVWVEKLFKTVDTEANAQQLAKDLGISLDRPHHVPRCSNTERDRNFVITMCSDNREQPLHNYAISGTDEADAEKLRTLGLNVRSAKKGWKVESSHANLGDVYEILKKVQSVMDVNVIEKARFGNKSLPFCQAANVVPGMKVFVRDNNVVIMEEVVEVRRKIYTGNVYDLNINRVHNYIANGIITHNSIYHFRGADSKAFKRIKETLEKTQRGVVSCDLPINYRSDEAIIEHARQWVPKLEGRGSALGQQKGEVNFDTTYSQALQWANNSGEEEFCFLCRINVPLVVTAYQLIAQGKRVCIIGRQTIASPMLSIIEDLCGSPDRFGNVPEHYTDRITDRKTHDGTVVEEGLLTRLAAYYRAQAAKFTEEGLESALEDLTNNVDCIEIIAGRVQADSVKAVIAEIESLFVEKPDDKGTIKLSTVHRAKGLEWDVVLVLCPHLMPHPLVRPNEDGSWSEEQQQEENLQYVCATRAKYKLHYICNWPFGRGKGSRLQPAVNDYVAPSTTSCQPSKATTMRPQAPARSIEISDAGRKVQIVVESPVVKGPATPAPTFVDNGEPF